MSASTLTCACKCVQNLELLCLWLRLYASHARSLWEAGGHGKTAAENGSIHQHSGRLRPDLAVPRHIPGTDRDGLGLKLIRY